ncbi:MAG: hypothetical protein HYV27_13000 [Candidatus Hydrogenedentes bacterium]|nr:hypothetical protein [Candidatus Hydrogenedentota bacterium]
MGLNSLQAIEPAFGFFKGTQPVLPALLAPAKNTPPTPAQANSGDSVEFSNQARTLFFQQQVSFAVQQSQLLVQQQNTAPVPAASGEAPPAPSGFSASAQQLEFSFVSETRYAELAQFSQRTSETAGRLGESQAASYTELSQSVAARFEFSVSISSSAVNGFAESGDQLADAEDLFNQFLELSKDLLAQADELFNEFFNSLSGNTVTEGTPTFQDRFNALIQQFLEKLSPNLGGAQGAPANGATTQSQTVQLEFKFSFEASFTATQTQVQQADPIILDLDDDGFELTDYRDGAKFDLLANGAAQNTAFVNGGDAFLALDRNNDGQIDNGAELFGEQRGARNGFEELRKLDSNGDSVIDALDKDYALLKLFKDNGNGKTEKGELISLKDAGIASIDLNYIDTDQRAAGNNRITQLASFTRSDGSKGKSADALLNLTI